MELTHNNTIIVKDLTSPLQWTEIQEGNNEFEWLTGPDGVNRYIKKIPS